MLIFPCNMVAFPYKMCYHDENGFFERGFPMDNLSLNLLIHALASFLCLVLAQFLIHKEPRRMINGFLLELALYHGAFAVLYIGFLIAPETVGMTIGMIFVFFILFSLLGTSLLLMVDGILVLKREGFSLTHLQPIVWSLFILAGDYAWYLNCFSGVSGSVMEVTLQVFMMNIVLYVPLALGGFVLYSFTYRRLKKPTDCPYVIVLGCGIRKDGTVTPLLKGRLDAAIRWYEQGGRQARFIVSGGQGKNEVTSEAAAMKQYLLSQGIPEDKIIEENRSTTTRENLLFSKAIMEKEGRRTQCIIATSDYHVLRAVLLARELKIDAQGIGGKTALYYVPAASLREYLALVMRHKPMIVVYLVYVIGVTIASMFL